MMPLRIDVMIKTGVEVSQSRDLLLPSFPLFRFAYISRAADKAGLSHLLILML